MDQLDKAKDIELDHRKRSLDSQLKKSIETEEPHEVDGIRYCLDCDDKIPNARLVARPESVRCVDCKSMKEDRDSRYA